jgi:hypothetical protein
MLIAIAGICLGVYTGFWVMFVGGIVDIIDAIKAPVTEASAIGWAVAKIFFAGLVGGIIAWIGIALGAVLGFSTIRFRYRNRRFR